jgi:hypothetical protein
MTLKGDPCSMNLILIIKETSFLRQSPWAENMIFPSADGAEAVEVPARPASHSPSRSEGISERKINFSAPLWDLTRDTIALQAPSHRTV